MVFFKQSILLLSLILFGFQIQAQRNCATMEYLANQLDKDPGLQQRMDDIQRATEQFILNGSYGSRDLVTIPVVVHVIYNNPTENISDAQVLTQIQVLNDDFRRLNSDADDTWPQAADTEIEFCMATIDPNGNSSNGITRTSTSVSAFGTNDEMKYNSSGGKDAWPASDYLNIWVCDISGGILGYAQFPGGNAATDGVVIDYQYFGTIGTATAPFNLGRTGTHEVGHWLNLRHIWGDGNCNVDDFVTDTPISDAANYGCSTGHVSCGTTDMVQNYMDYSDDACMNLYTLGQKNRMQSLFGSGGSRESLLSSGACGGGTPPTCDDGIQNGSETGVDCGGPDCTPCESSCSDNEVTLTLNFDNYPEETSWQITDSNNNVVESGGTYGNQADGSTLILEFCLPNGCYDFTISDSYGDGICCSYGNGSYSLTMGSETLASGGSFSSTEVTNFCLAGNDPTCDDGIQNGSETGVDCGGPDCAACVSCDDGIQNGSETGIDCGGPDCAACPTCDDGIQNGSETGVDCGGPDCAECITCNDGIQNGSETGVDCGGPDCAACPTCDDGIQNGSETGVDCGGPDCAPCSTNCSGTEVSLTLIFDNYPEETSWEIRDNAGNLVESGGTYGNQADGSTLILDMCLVNGCYDFIINDAYGDGICCAYGSGSYSLTAGNITLAEGGNFTNSETTNFCVSNESPTCEDGIQNGSETGIDCGGSDCEPCGSGGSDLIFGHYFESGWDGWTDGGSDVARYSGARSYEGNYSIRLRDNSGAASTMTSQSVDLSQYNSVTLEFHFYPYSMENGEDFWLRYFDGNSWSTIATYTRGTDFDNNNFYVSSITLDNGNYTFPSDAQFSFQCDASGNQDHIYIDAIVLNGFYGNARSGKGIQTELLYGMEEEFEIEEPEISLFPNPVNEALTVEAEALIQSIQIVDVMGKVFIVEKDISTSKYQLDVQNLAKGLYFINIEIDDEIHIIKFIKI